MTSPSPRDNRDNTDPVDRDPHVFPHSVVTLRPIATPMSLGFLGLTVASFVLAGLELRWIDPITNWNTVGLVILVFTVPLQAISAIFGFLARDAVAATGMGVLSGTWLAVGSTMFTGTPGVPSSALGLLLLASGTAMLVPAAAGLSGKTVASLVMLTAAIRFFLTGAYQMTDSASWRVAGAVCGLVLSALAIYAAVAFELESTHKRTILPVGRRGRGRISLAGSLADETVGVQHEPGVRQML